MGAGRERHKPHKRRWRQRIEARDGGQTGTSAGQGKVRRQLTLAALKRFDE
jgi:hypothetical protein